MRGFTLLETLVGVLILGFLLVGLAGGARFGAGAAIRQGQSSERAGDLEAVDRVLRQVVASADPGAKLSGTSGTLALVAELPGREGADAVAVGLEGGRLLLRATPHRSGRSLVPPTVRSSELLGGVAGISFAYYGAGTEGDPAPAWRERWDRAGLPALIRLRIAFADPAVRWPDIVMAPQRSR